MSLDLTLILCPYCKTTKAVVDGKNMHVAHDGTMSFGCPRSAPSFSTGPAKSISAQRKAAHQAYANERIGAGKQDV